MAQHPDPRLNVEGFIIFDHFAKFPAFMEKVAPMVANGQVKFREDIAEGIESAPQAFLDILQGRNFGKQLVRIGADPES